MAEQELFYDHYIRNKVSYVVIESVKFSDKMLRNTFVEKGRLFLIDIHAFSP